jgi:hypothetical protein
MADDVFASCNEAVARAGVRHGLFEWEGRAELSPGRVVALAIAWWPEEGVLLAEVVAAARASWDRLRSTEASHRRAAVAEMNGPRQWLRVRAEDLYPTGVTFLPDGSAEVRYGGIETGGHRFIVEVSSEGHYLGYRIE